MYFINYFHHNVLHLLATPSALDCVAQLLKIIIYLLCNLTVLLCIVYADAHRYSNDSHSYGGGYSLVLHISEKTRLYR